MSGVQDEKRETVNHPDHYNSGKSGKFEVIDVIEDWNLGFNTGNAVKYIARAPYKLGALDDYKKAIWYLQREVKLLETTIIKKEMDQIRTEAISTAKEIITEHYRERPINENQRDDERIGW